MGKVLHLYLEEEAFFDVDTKIVSPRVTRQCQGVLCAPRCLYCRQIYHRRRRAQTIVDAGGRYHHDHLEGGQCIGEAKWHDHIRVLPVVGVESCLDNVRFSDPYLVIPRF